MAQPPTFDAGYMQQAVDPGAMQPTQSSPLSAEGLLDLARRVAVLEKEIVELKKQQATPVAG